MTCYSFPDLKFTFTTLDGQGPAGPTDTSGYQGTTLQGKVTLDKGIQIWQVPVNGSYAIEAWGASGAQGQGKDGERPGGKGAYMKGTFNLTRGTLLKILVGQAGSHGTVGMPPLAGGGGGGTFITSSSNTTLIVAGGGGGGGAALGNNHDGDPGQIVEQGSRSGGSNGSGGTILRKGSPSVSFEGGAGGGLVGDGESAELAGGGKSFVNGGEGGKSTGTEANGGYGGGGGGIHFPGAGGGYSGGGVLDDGGKIIAGGGGSYNGGGNQVKKEGVKEGDGKVIITLEDSEQQ